jgi:hypothetical protein
MPYVLTQKPKIGGLINQKSKVILSIVDRSNFELAQSAMMLIGPD